MVEGTFVGAWSWCCFPGLTHFVAARIRPEGLTYSLLRRASGARDGEVNSPLHRERRDSGRRFSRGGGGNTVGFLTMATLLEARELRKSYSRATGVLSGNGRGPRFTAVDGVSFSVAAGETFAVVGESGCGKTTLARMLLRLIEPDSGEIVFAGRDLLALSAGELRAQRREMQMIFQDPFASLDPRMRVGEIVGEPLAIHESKLSKADRASRTLAILERVGLRADALRRYPHEFSGGQRQRIGIARALILRPKLIVADEPVSALDVSVGAQVLLLLRELQSEFNLTYVFISHSLPVVAQLATRIAVMRAGKFVELGEAEQVLHHPTHEYTRELLSAIPVLPVA